MATSGYYRFPAIHHHTLIFTSEDDLWTVPAGGGVARRLTANLGAISSPFFSPDGSQIAYTGREEGHAEVYVMPAVGGPSRRLTYLGATSTVMGWTTDGKQVLFSTDAGQPFDRIGYAHSVNLDGGMPQPWPIGPAVSLSSGSGGRSVVGRNNNDPARWKRYRGGTAGDIWIDVDGSGIFRRLLQLNGNVARPMWLGDRIFFLSDHEGIGNLYSCLPTGEDISRHTHRADYYVRFPNSDGTQIVYQAGADLYLFDPSTNQDKRVEIEYHSPRVYRQRKFVDAAKYLESYAPHPQGHSLALTSRGKSFTFGNWEGAVTPQGGEASPRRYRLTRWLNDGRHIISITDEGGIETLEIHDTLGEDEPIRLEGLDIGHPYALRVSPTEDQLLLSNHRNEMIWVDLTAKKVQVVDRSPFRHIEGFSWSPDGLWVAYGFSITPYRTAIKLWNCATNAIHTATQPILHDTDPVFDPEGKYLYFLSLRELNPVYDSLHFDLGFPRGMRPCLLTLRTDLRSPFSPMPRPLKEGRKTETKPTNESDPADDEENHIEESTSTSKVPPSVVIDIEGITDRVLTFPVPEGRYGQIIGIEDKALFTSFPVEGALNRDNPMAGPPANGTLEVFDFETQKHEALLFGVTDIQIAKDGKTLVYRSGNRLRVVKAGMKPDEKAASEPPNRRNGWIDFSRIRVSVEPGIEWQQMAREAWRLQKEYFWTADMSNINWDLVWARYAPLIDRVGTRGEFSDLMWDMQGELGTSHAYEMGGDYRPEPTYPQGFLGADFAYDSVACAYRISRIVPGTPGDPDASSPLRSPGVNVREGDKLIAINGRRLTDATLPQELLVHQAGTEVTLTVQSGEEKPRTVTCRALKSEYPLRYRAWVEANRRMVHEATGGRVGYVHIPDMGARGYAEFHRLYLTEVEFDGLIVDVRYNRGGHVSELLIEKLARKRVGYDIQRWGQPSPYPSFSVAGPIVALTNQWAGSDGDIFSHVFKLKRLGPLIGKRTWGGVIGIWPRNPLADGSITTQPEFSFWFMDVGWGVENYGTDPDIDIDIAPQDYAGGYDPQMEKALAVVLERLETEPVVKPTFADRPNLSPPPFPDSLIGSIDE